MVRTCGEPGAISARAEPPVNAAEGASNDFRYYSRNFLSKSPSKRSVRDYGDRARAGGALQRGGAFYLRRNGRDGKYEFGDEETATTRSD